MIPDIRLGDLFKYGGLLKDVEGSTPEEVYRNICNQIELPKSLSSNDFYDALCQREKILTTAVGEGVAIPHARSPLIKDFVDQRIFICYLKNPIDMNAIDMKKVSVMFVVLTSNSHSHLQVISQLASLLKNKQFKKQLELKADLDVLVDIASFN